jgi:hypothetical protein
MQAALLDDRAIIAVSGAEARSFLQGLVTNDMDACVPGRAIYAALLTPQGKILFEFFIVAGGENLFFLDAAAARASDLVKRLSLYRLRAKVEIALRPDLAVAAIWGDDANAEIKPDALAFRDPRLAALGVRMTDTRDGLAAAIRGIAQGDYHSHRLTLGVPDSADLPSDQVFALDAGLEELNGVSFKKGCYVGQEVTSRMKHRATARRRFTIAEISGDLPPPGTPLESEGRELGTLGVGKAGRGLALVRLDRLAEAEGKGAPITAAGRSVVFRKPGWFGG